MGKQLLSYLFAAVLGLNAFAAGQEEWPPISDADRALKDCAAQPGAPAVCLLTEQTTDLNDWTFRAFARIKVLTPGGREFGNIEIPFSEAWEVKEIRARVIQPDGRVEPYSGPVLEKTLVRIGRVRQMVKTIALPAVEAGSIIDYRFLLQLNWNKAASARSLRLERWKPEEGGIPDVPGLAYAVEQWDFDFPLYTYKARYALRYRAIAGHSHWDLTYVSYGLLSGPPAASPGRVELEVENIPARAKEDGMAPEEEDRMGVTFFLCNTRVENVDSYWQQESASWQNAVKQFIRVDVKAESQALVAGASGPLERLKALYDRAQRIENLSYAPDLTPEKKKELKIKANRNAAEVLKRNAGLRSDITRTFAALAWVAGFEVDLVRVVSRDDKFFNENILDFYGQFDRELAVVTVDGREMFLDPATPFCPMRLVHWVATDAPFVRAFGSPGKIEKTPLDPPERAARRGELDLRLDGEGGLVGTASFTWSGQDALRLRLENLGADETGLRKTLEEKMAALLPEGGKASLRAVGNMTGTDDSLRVDYEVALPGVVVEAGDRKALAVVPLRPEWRDSFRNSSRRTSVYFPYLARESLDIVIALPEGVTVEAVPTANQADWAFARYSLAAAAEGGTKVRVHREFAIGKSLIPPGEYPLVRAFFDKVRAADDGQIVLSSRKK
ncbi:MAG TPA: DUF3858 domain-containing protein [Acidobacteriota bacterium]|nr:DUF3858 domain-containing protein [Acidobacteriota bacterium]